MTRKETIIFLLGKYGNGKTRVELTELYYEDFANMVDEKRRYYISHEIDKTEKELFNQIAAEIGSTIYRDEGNDDIILTERGSGSLKYSLGEKGILIYNELINTKEEPEITTDDIHNDVEEVFETDNKGIVYLLLSKTYTDTYKIGITINLQNRLQQLSRDNRYGVFNLEPKMYVSCNNYQLVEQVLHKFFEDFRLGRRNDLNVDTELFKGDETIEYEFELFIEMLQKNPRYKVEELIKV